VRRRFRQFIFTEAKLLRWSAIARFVPPADLGTTSFQIRYERLNDDYLTLLNRLGVADAYPLPRHKTEIRRADLDVRDYYDPVTTRLLQKYWKEDFNLHYMRRLSRRKKFLSLERLSRARGSLDV